MLWIFETKLLRPMSEDKMLLEHTVQYPYYQLQSRTNYIKLFGVIEITSNHWES
jgi:hypothetical protein